MVKPNCSNFSIITANVFGFFSPEFYCTCSFQSSGQLSREQNIAEFGCEVDVANIVILLRVEIIKVQGHLGPFVTHRRYVYYPAGGTLF